MNRLIIIFLSLSSILISCREGNIKKEHSSTRSDSISTNLQDSIFLSLLQVTGPAIAEKQRNQQLAFLILPLDASCPSCRTKTIDSIIRNIDQLQENHFIILSLTGGKKNMGFYFKDRKSSLPVHPAVVLDSLNLTSQLSLHETNPTFYYTDNGKARRKVVGLPNTIKGDLHDFFQ